MPGLYFDDFTVGRHFAHEVTRTITEADNIWFSCLTLNPQPLHIDAHAAARSEYGRPIVNSLFTLGLLVGLTVADTTLNTTVANLGFTDVKFPAPVFPVIPSAPRPLCARSAAAARGLNRASSPSSTRPSIRTASRSPPACARR